MNKKECKGSESGEIRFLTSYRRDVGTMYSLLSLPNM